MSRFVTFGTTSLLLLAACFWRGTPVPVQGDLSRYAGHWEGSYSSVETGRSGSIVFELVAGTDSAYGDVLMVPAQQVGNLPPGDPRRTGAAGPAPHALRISFVRSEGDRVTGTLDVYQDPETGESLLTKFQGRLRGDGIKGTYSTLTSGTGRMVTGEWSVKRSRR